jgi:hypothetical protein
VGHHALQKNPSDLASEKESAMAWGQRSVQTSALASEKESAKASGPASARESGME